MILPPELLMKGFAMDADDSTIEKILKYARRFMVPLYQRKYEWDDERLIPF